MERIPQAVMAAVMMRLNKQLGNSEDDDTLKVLREADIPDNLLQALAPFQQEGVRFVMNNDGRALVADEMGLGKCVLIIHVISIPPSQYPQIATQTHFYVFLNEML